MYIAYGVVMVIDGKEYHDNELSRLSSGRLRLHTASAVTRKFAFSQLDYEGRSKSRAGTPEVIEYDCKAQDKNGHVKRFLMRIPNQRQRITLVRS